MISIVKENMHLDKILLNHRKDLGGDFTRYKGHCYRILNYVLYLQKHKRNEDLLGIAIGFHDLAIWIHQTMDYLEPSFQLAREYCRKEQLAISIDDVRAIILEHHKMNVTKKSPCAEYVRKADLVDLSFGAIRSGIDRTLIKQMQIEWPYVGFQKMIFSKVIRYAFSHPANPLPMLKW